MLGRSEILRLIKDENLLSDWDEKALGGSGYDLRAGRFYRLKSSSFLGVSSRKTPQVEEIFGDKLVLAPDEYVLVESVESVKMPAGVAARILPRSSLFRCGCMLYTALVDPGFTGTLTMGLKNECAHEFTLERGARVAQIVFEKVEGTTTLYAGKYQGGKIV
ncbi:Deoxyuridine 5'-triphosphate nucleotidohydrolase [uncultured archaeon]|nr:Deoxyuridine 5'-triphosphate nucleotidohydrolase [uncultured archaeon]